jgi:hypothetical protein
MRVIQAVRAALEIPRELLDGFEIRRDGRGGKVPTLEFLQHGLA